MSGVRAVKTSRTRYSVMARSSTGYQVVRRSATKATIKGATTMSHNPAVTATLARRGSFMLEAVADGRSRCPSMVGDSSGRNSRYCRRRMVLDLARRRSSTLLGVTLLAVVVALPLRGLWRGPGPPMEEGFMLVFPDLVRHGLVANRDFLHLYGPGSLWVLAAVYAAFGTLLQVERMVGLLQLLGVIAGVFALTRRWGPWSATAAGALAAVVILPPTGLTAMAWVGAVALGLWSVHLGVRAVEGEGDAYLVAGAALGGFALLYRPDLVVAVGGSAIVVMLGLETRRRRRYVAAAVAGVSPFLVHVAMAGPAAVWRGLVYEPVFQLRGGRRLPLPPSWSDFDGFLQRAGRLDEPAWPFPAPPSPAQLVLWLVLLFGATALVVAVGVRAFRARGDRRLLAAGVFAAGLLPQALQRPDSTHLAWVGCVAFALAPVAMVELVGSRVVRRVIAAAVPLALVFALLPDFTFRSYADLVNQSLGRGRPVGTMRNKDRIFYYGRGDAVAAVDRLIARVHEVSAPGDRLFVGTGDLRYTPYSEAFLYYLLGDLTPATRYIEMDPGVANALGSGMADDLASADVVVLSSIRDDWNEPNDSLHAGSDEATKVLEKDFCIDSSFGDGLFGRGLYVLYARCAAPSTRP